MAFKEKLRDAWKRVSDLDDETESAKKQSRDTERIPYKEISKRLKEIMKENVDIVGRKILIPLYYAIYFNEADRNLRLEVEDVICEELKQELFHEMRKINPELSKGELLIEIKTDSTVEKGEFKVGYRMKKPAHDNDVGGTPEPAQEPQPEIDDENDYKQTLVEAQALPDDDDEKATIVQAPENATLYTLAIKSGENTQSQVITKQIITLGRSKKDDVVLESPDFSISREHASIEVRDGQFFLTPIGINGTLLNGEDLELKKEVKITPDDEIKIMDYILHIQT